MIKKITIAIDGPTGSGKSSTAKALAKKLGYVHLDSGAIYRAVCFYFLEHKIKPTDIDQISRHLKRIKIYFKNGHDIFLNGNDVTNLIRTPEVNKNVAIYARVQKIRDFVTSASQQIIKKSGVILDGRDAGAVIAPQAELKIYLDADLQKRAERRLKDFGYKNTKENIKKVLEEVITPKDEYDHKTLSVAKRQGVVVDTGDLTFQQQVKKIYNLALEKITK